MRYFTILIIFFSISCTSTTVNNGLSLYHVHNNTIIERFIFYSQMEKEIKRMPVSLRPTADDIYTTSVDLNNDGKNDILAVIKHYKFINNGKYKLFTFIKNEYDYLELSPQPFVSFNNIKVLKNITNGYYDIDDGDNILKFSNNSYK